MVQLNGRTALVTGAARGQGRSHAVKFAEAGADVVICDIARKMPTTLYDGATPEDLGQTKKLVEAIGKRCVSVQADVRDGEQMRDVVRQGLSAFGAIDIVSANAGIMSTTASWELSDEQWNEMLSVNLTGVWQTAKAVIPQMIENRRGSIVLTASVNGFVAYSHMAHYVAAKHGVIGLMRALAVELGPYGIRVNTVCPTTVPTHMVHPSFAHLAPGVTDPTWADVGPGLTKYHLLDMPWVQPEDISAAVLWLASDEARYVTGVALPVDGGALTMPPGYRSPSDGTAAQ